MRGLSSTRSVPWPRCWTLPMRVLTTLSSSLATPTLLTSTVETRSGSWSAEGYAKATFILRSTTRHLPTRTPLRDNVASGIIVQWIMNRALTDLSTPHTADILTCHIRVNAAEVDAIRFLWAFLCARMQELFVPIIHSNA